MSFSFNVVGLCVVTINEKPWTRATEMCRTLRYKKKSYAQEYQLSSVPAADTPVDWPKDSQQFDIYINEEWIYELLFSIQQPKAKDFRRHCFNVLFPHVQQQLSDKSHAMEIEDLTGRIQALEFTNEAYRQAIEEKDAALAFLNNDQKNREHDNVVLQAQRDVYKDQLQKCQDIIAHLRTCYIDHAKDLGKDNIVIITEKNFAQEEDEFYEYP